MSSAIPHPPAAIRHLPSLFIMRSGALGDFILTLPALRALRHTYPEHRLMLAARADVLPLAHGLVADAVLAFDSALLTPLFIADGETDALQNLLGEVALAVLWLPDITARIVADNLRRLNVAHLIAANPMPTQRHASEHLLDTLAPLGSAAQLVAAASAVAWPLTPRLQALADEFWQTHALEGMRVIALHLGSGGAHKRWHSANFLTLAQRLMDFERTHVICISGPAEEDLHASRFMLHAPRFTPLASPPLPLLASILARCALYIGNDSGVTHLAAVLGVPTVALFGPTDAQVWGPRGAQVAIVRSPTQRMDDLTLELVWPSVLPYLTESLSA